MTVVDFGFDFVGGDRLPEAWPTTPRVVFRVARKKRLITNNTAIDAGLLRIVVHAGERPLGATVLRDFILFRRKPAAEFFFSERLLGHGSNLVADSAGVLNQVDVVQHLIEHVTSLDCGETLRIAWGNT